MDIHEYQNKRLFKEYNIPILMGNVAYTPTEAVSTAQNIGGLKWSVKAQLYSHDKLAGHFVDSSPHNKNAIQTASSLEEVQEIAAYMLGKAFITPSMKTPQVIQRIYIEEVCEIQKTFAVSVRVDIQAQKVIFCVQNGSKIKQYDLLNSKPTLFLWYQLVRAFGLKGAQNAKLLFLLRQMYQLFVSYSALAVEFNPLVLTPAGDLIVLDGRIIFDNESLFLFPEIASLREVEAGKEREALAEQYNFRYVPFSGNIACLVNGSGLGSATIDLIKSKGGHPACLLDVGTEPSKESVSQAFKLALYEPDVEGVFVNIFGGITRCDVIAEGLISASKEISVGMPLIVRMDGTNAQIGTRLLFESRLPFIVLKELNEAVDMVIQKVEELS